MPLPCGLRTGVRQGFRPNRQAKTCMSFAMQDEPLSDGISMTDGARYAPKRRSAASGMILRMSEPLVPALTTARQAMISRSWASMMKAPRMMSPFRAG